MKKQIFAILFLIFLIPFSSIPSLAWGANSSVITIYIRSDGTVQPATTSIHRHNETYTLTSNVNATIVVQKNDIEFDGNGFLLQGAGIGFGIYLNSSKNVTIKNVRFKTFSAGIKLEQASTCNLYNNSIRACVYGILSSRSSNISIIKNRVVSNEWDGIFISSTDNSVMSDNIVANHSKWGVYIGDSRDFTLRNNSITGNSWNFAVSSKYIHDIDTSNTVNGKPIIYWINRNHAKVPENAGYVAIIASTYIDIKNLILEKNGQGIVLESSENCSIENSTTAENGYYGVQLSNSHNNTIKGNVITRNVDYGGIGIAMMRSSHNTICNNLIENNHLGISFSSSPQNLIYHNNFINNTRQASSSGSTNFWDDGYPSGGNYWSDYNGLDSNNDGLGDLPYEIDEINKDRYPFKEIFKETESNDTNHLPIIILAILVIVIISSMAIAYFGFGEKSSQTGELKS